MSILTSSTAAGSGAQDVYAALSGKDTKTASAADDTQSRFLKLLTTQLKNQDPMNPVDNAQTTSQLAQISTVDGIGKLNATLEKLMNSYQASEAMQAADLLGRGVLVEGSGLSLEEGAALGGVLLDGPADAVAVSILDRNGLEVRRLDLGRLDAGTHEFVWDGTSSNGTVARDGSYSVKVVASQGGASVPSHVLELATVNGVVTGGSEVKVDVGRLGRVSMGDIKLIL